MKKSHIINANTNITSNTIKSKQQKEQPSNSSEIEPNLEEKAIPSTQPNIEENEGFNNDPEKKDAIPLLIIDVNVRPGVKRKIYVYDGDTSESLADRFSKEHSNKINLLNKF